MLACLCYFDVRLELTREARWHVSGSQRPDIGDWALERQRQPRLQKGKSNLRSTFVPFTSQSQLLAMPTHSKLPASPSSHSPRTADFPQIARARAELACARPFVQPWLAVSLVLTDDKRRAWDKLGISYDAHVSFRPQVSSAIVPSLICCLAECVLMISV